MRIRSREGAKTYNERTTTGELIDLFTTDNLAKQ